MAVNFALVLLAHEFNWCLLTRGNVLSHIESYNRTGQWDCNVVTQKFINFLRLWQIISHNLLDWLFPSWSIIFDPTVQRSFFSSSQGLWELLRADPIYTNSLLLGPCRFTCLSQPRSVSTYQGPLIFSQRPTTYGEDSDVADSDGQDGNGTSAAATCKPVLRAYDLAQSIRKPGAYLEYRDLAANKAMLMLYSRNRPPKRREKMLQKGWYCFTKLPTEQFIRLGLAVSEVPGKAHGHITLANNMPVQYAGEVHITTDGLQQWTNKTGTYMAPAARATQSGLPITKFACFETLETEVDNGWWDRHMRAFSMSACSNQEALNMQLCLLLYPYCTSKVASVIGVITLKAAGDNLDMMKTLLVCIWILASVLLGCLSIPLMVPLHPFCHHFGATCAIWLTVMTVVILCMDRLG